jgi:hypothetical protein
MRGAPQSKFSPLTEHLFRRAKERWEHDRRVDVAPHRGTQEISRLMPTKRQDLCVCLA